MSEQQIHIGKISGVFGIKGWVKVFSYTDPKENILQYTPWILKKGNQSSRIKLVEGKSQGKALLARLQSVDDRNSAEALAGMDIYIDAQQLPELEDNEYYWADLVGLEVLTLSGQTLGTVDYLMRTGANDVLVVTGDRERLVPFLQGQTVFDIDLEKGSMRVDWDPDF